MAKFSIIVPIYNVEKYLATCIESVLNQTYNDFELILVDDGSPDGSPAICDQYVEKDNRIKVIHKKNGGLVSARKAGAEIAAGDYCICLDGDDRLHENYLAKYAEVINKYEPDVICSGVFQWNKNDIKPSFLAERKGIYTREQMEKEIFPYLIEDNKGHYFFPNVWSKAYKTELYKYYQNVVDDRIKIGEDHACTKPLIAAAQSMFILEDCLYYYRNNDQSMTKERKPFSWEVPKLISSHMENNMNLATFDFQQQIYRTTVHNFFNVAVSRFNQDKSYQEVKKEILQWLQDPYYRNAIQKCRYRKFPQGQLAHAALKYRMTGFIYMYWKYMK